MPVVEIILVFHFSVTIAKPLTLHILVIAIIKENNCHLLGSFCLVVVVLGSLLQTLYCITRRHLNEVELTITISEREILDWIEDTWAKTFDQYSTVWVWGEKQLSMGTTIRDGRWRRDNKNVFKNEVFQNSHCAHIRGTKLFFSSYAFFSSIGYSWLQYREENKNNIIIIIITSSYTLPLCMWRPPINIGYISM